MIKKILILFVTLAMLTPQFKAEELPSWITVKYSDLEAGQVSEYQLVTIIVSEKNFWFKNSDYQVDVEYDLEILTFANAVYTNTGLETSVLDQTRVTTSENNFYVKYQFYLKPNVDVESATIKVIKSEDNLVTDTQLVEVKAQSYTTPKEVTFGNVTLNYAVTNYVDNEQTVEYTAHFEVLDNPKNEPFSLSLKKNNMSVSGDNSYTVSVEPEKGLATEVEANEFLISANTGDNFDLKITAIEANLSAKNDRFEFFIYLNNNDKFVRLEPTFFKSTEIGNSDNVRLERYVLIEVLLALVILALLLVHISSRKHQK